jgi:hypothetical protein
MKRIGILLGAFVWLSAAQLKAQDAASSPFTDESEVPYESASASEAETSSIHVSWGQLQPTAQMWLYEQEKADYLDPKLAVRRKAAAKTAQRQARIAAMKWYGMSNSRPYANPTPIMGSYSPTWSSNNYNAYRWTPGYSQMVTRPNSVQFNGSYGLW